MRTVADECCRENQYKLFCVQLICIENRAVYVEKYYTAGQATDVNMAHAHFMMDT